jgi:hypothetical protein
MAWEDSVRLAQHADQHRPEDPVFFAIDQELGEGAALWVAPELSDPIGTLEVGSIRTWSSSARGARPMARDAPVRRLMATGSSTIRSADRGGGLFACRGGSLSPRVLGQRSLELALDDVRRAT